MIIKFEYYWKCIRIYEKAHLISDFRKKYLLSWGSNPRNETKPEEIYDNERVCLRKIVLSFLLDFSGSPQVTTTISTVFYRSYSKESDCLVKIRLRAQSMKYLQLMVASLIAIEFCAFVSSVDLKSSFYRYIFVRSSYFCIN